MSIIFQTLNKLQTEPQGEALPMAEDSAQDAITGRSKHPLRRRLMRAGIVIGAFIVPGVALIFSLNFLSGYLPPFGAQTIGNPISSASIDGANVEDKSLRHVVATTTTPIYIPPDRLDQTSTEATVSPSTSKTNNGIESAQTPSVDSANDKPGEMSQASFAINSDSDQIMGTPSATAQAFTPARPENDVLPPLNTVPEKILAMPEPMSTEQRKAEVALKVAREKNERISRLVSQLESALSRPTMENDRIEEMLNQLEKLKQPGSPYVEKLRAYWLLKEEKYDQAKVILEKLAAANQEDVEVGINLAVIDIRSGDTPAALQRLQRLKKSQPDNILIADLIRKLK